MNKYLIATHGELAKGIQSTIELFAGQGQPISYVSAYTDETKELGDELYNFFDKLNIEDSAVIFTDLYGGSVNQKVSVMASEHKNIFIIAGFNLPVILETVLSQEKITQSFIESVIKKGKDNLKLVQLQSDFSENDQDFFN
ncbi:PTS sugar transporter subunit IIA [Lactobacillus sp. UCMA15818]|uniref:PTS sugar transporter subunit IIA n=1 Tax=Lactobacillus sp. UCMA15818 TaxID=2583394 RepID=UPI0025AFA87D|nr:PTS sugar transporter subunit IIA [Lactobacillus sp. UCMA15818]MDN2453401.1 PTS sugar transporter subunit IIA [Lactobacillus sp. UCMA15818]